MRQELDHMSIRLAMTNDLAAVEECVRDAYSIYTERIGKPSAPMLEGPELAPRYSPNPSEPHRQLA